MASHMRALYDAQSNDEGEFNSVNKFSPNTTTAVYRATFEVV